MDVFSININEPAYPRLLKELFDPPSPFYCMGNVEIFRRPCVAIVGTRMCTAYGEAAAFKFAKELSLRGITIVSGLAFGIDAAAHMGALEGPGGTIAVLSSALPGIQPRTHKELAAQIIRSGGAIVSEKTVGSRYLQTDYLVRNRIIAGLAPGVLVIEAGVKSGALNTANHAVRENREVFAVPGRIGDEKSAGALKLIKEGAALVTNAREVAEALGFTWKDLELPSAALSEIEKNIFLSLCRAPKTAAELCEELSVKVLDRPGLLESAKSPLSKASTPLGMPEIFAAITSLEMQGLLRLSLDLRYLPVREQE